MNIFSKIITIILLIVMVCLLPLLYLMDHYDGLKENYVEGELIEFVNEIQTNKYIDIHMYEDFLSRLYITGKLYEIEIEQFTPKLSANLAIHDKSESYLVSSIRRENSPTSYNTHSHTHTSTCYDGEEHIHSTVNGSCYSWQGHVHSGDSSYGGSCYSARYHVHSGSSSSGGACYGGRNYHNHTSTCYHSHSYSCYHHHDSRCYTRCNGSFSVQVPPSTSKCSTCKGYRRSVSTICNSCGQNSFRGYLCSCGGPNPTDYTRQRCTLSVCTCGKSSPELECSISTSSPICGKSNNYVESYYMNCNKGTNTIEGYYLTCNKTGEYKLTCGKTNGKYYKGDIEVFPNCHKIIVSIKPEKPKQIIYLGDAIISKAIITYLDGHCQTVLCSNDYEAKKLGMQTVTLTYGEASCNIEVDVKARSRACSSCGKDYYLDKDNFDMGCPDCHKSLGFIQVSPRYITLEQYEELDVTVTANFKDGHSKYVTEWTSNYDSSKLGYQEVTINYNEHKCYLGVNIVSTIICDKCGNSYVLDEDGNDPGCYICKDILISINASPKELIINKGEGLTQVVVRAYYVNGGEKVVEGWTSDFNKNIAGRQEVTIYYKNQSCKIIVEVMSDDEVTCPLCQARYSRSESPWGCPICRETLVGIEASLISGGNKVVYGRGLDLRVILIYKDGHRQMVFDGWKDNFDPYLYGEQVVIVTYKDKFGNIVSYYLSVTVVEDMESVICEKGHVYYPGDFTKDCPYCAANSGAKVETYYEYKYTDHILSHVYEEDIYHLKPGDYVTIKISIIPRDGQEKLISYGGEVP